MLAKVEDVLVQTNASRDAFSGYQPKSFLNAQSRCLHITQRPVVSQINTASSGGRFFCTFTVITHAYHTHICVQSSYARTVRSHVQECS